MRWPSCNAAISVLTGTPGSGKTTFATWLCSHLVRIYGIRIGMCMFETEPDEILNQLICIGYPSMKDDPRAVAAKLDDNYRLLHRVDRDNVGYDLEWLKGMIKGLVREHCSFIVVDPWNELLHEPRRGENITSYVNDALAYLRQLAEKYNIHIMLIAHPRKMEGNTMPTGYHISDSAAWVNKPDMGWTVHPDTDDQGNEIVRLKCWKVRSRHETGCEPGNITLNFIPETMSYRPKGWSKGAR
jgi:twinkle protein